MGGFRSLERSFLKRKQKCKLTYYVQLMRQLTPSIRTWRPAQLPAVLWGRNWRRSVRLFLNFDAAPTSRSLRSLCFRGGPALDGASLDAHHACSEDYKNFMYMNH